MNLTIDRSHLSPTWTREMELELRQLLWVANERAKCARKTKYASYETAMTMGDEVTKVWRKKNKVRDRHLEAYCCRWCGFWHTTTIPGRNRVAP